MEQEAKLKVNMSTYRRLNIQHKINEDILKQDHLLKLKFYKSRKEIFIRKLEHTNDQHRSFLRISSPTPISSHHRNSNKEQFLNNEHKTQLKNNEQKAILLKQFDELKHTINDPNSTISAITALSQTLLDLDSRIK